MFLVRDTIQARHTKIRSFLQNEPVISVLLAASDFEWTIRRAIIAMSKRPNKQIRDLLRKTHGLDNYKKIWNREVKPICGKGLPEVVPEWDRFKNTSFPLRDKIIHGIKVSPGKSYAILQTERILTASTAVVEFAKEAGYFIYGKHLPIKRVVACKY